MFFKAAQKGINNWQTYLTTIVICGVAYMFGQLPFVAYLQSQGASQEDLTQRLAEVTSNIENKNMVVFLIALMFVALFAAFYVCITKLHKKKLKWVATGAKAYRWHQFWFAFGVAAIFIIATTVIGYYMAPEDYIVQFNPKKFIILFLIVSVFISLQASTEELIFRGYFTQGIGLLFKNRLAALLIPSLIFASVHLSNPEVQEHGIVKMFPLYFIGALTFGILTLMNDGIELAMGYHAANNIVIALLYTSPEAVLQTDSILRLVEVQELDGQYITLIIVEVVIIAIFAWKYKWTNWREKLFGSITIENNLTV